MVDLDLSFIDRLVIPASVYDVNGLFLHLNPAGEQVGARTKVEKRGSHFTDVIPVGERKFVLSQFNRALGGEPSEFEALFEDGNGDVRAVRTLYIPLRERGEVVAVLMLAFDSRLPLPLPRPGVAERSLTKRQAEILEMMAGGRSTAEIATELSLSVETVRNHIRSLLRVLDAHTRLEAVIVARRLGLLAPGPFGAAVESRRAVKARASRDARARSS